MFNIMALKERILQFIEYKGLTVQQFEKNVGLSNAAVSKMGDNTRSTTLDKISNMYPDLSRTWLLTGVGEMLKSASSSVNVMQGNVVTDSAVAQGEKSSASVILPYDTRWLDELRAQREITQVCQSQLSTCQSSLVESQSQVTRLLGIIEKIQGLK